MSDERNKMFGQWINMEHYRLHCVEEWPASPYMEAVQAAIRSSLERFTTSSAEPVDATCMIRAAPRTESVVREFPSKPQRSPIVGLFAA